MPVMQTKELHLKDFIFIVPGSFLLSAGLSSLQNGTWWIGWLGFSALFVIGLIALVVAWRWGLDMAAVIEYREAMYRNPAAYSTSATRTLAWMIGLALLLRLAAGVAVYIALPINGHDSPDDKAGYVFTDAHRRDDQAWELASSGKPLWSAFDKSYYTDQYGGLLAFSALTYRYLSPDAQRPLLIVLLASLMAALGVPFLYKAARLLFNDQIGIVSSWLFILYPESILTGGAQMREPFLLTFLAMLLWGFADWLINQQRSGWYWMAVGFVGMLMVSPAIALVSLLIFAGWLYVRRDHKEIPWQALVSVSVVFIVALLVLSWSLNRNNDFGTQSPVGVILNWFRQAVKWDTYQLQRGSGWIQLLFKKMNTSQQLFFVIVYGVLQPVLPAAFVEPSTTTWQIISVLRAIGWYALLPLLIYLPIAIFRMPPGPGRRLWLWIAVVSWIWILICSIRAGGDQWDNPRYRLILFAFEALSAAYAWTWWRAHRDGWLPRILTLEVIGVLIFLQWYLSRYYHVGGQLPFFFMVGLIVLISLVIIIGGWLWDRRARSKPA